MQSLGDRYELDATGLQLMRAADRRIGQPLCLPLARAQLERADFPDLARLYGELGVRVASGRVVLSEEAPLAALRQALTAPKAALRRSPRDRPSLQSRRHRHLPR